MTLRCAGIEGVHEIVIFFRYEAPADLARPRQLAVVGIELLVQDEEALDLRAGHHFILSK